MRSERRALRKPNRRHSLTITPGTENCGMRLPSVLLLLSLAVVGSAPTHAAGCSLGRLAELPVTMIGLRPLVHAKINGKDALFLADSGAFYSTITPAAAAEYKLSLAPSPVPMEGVGGEAQTWITRVRTFTIFDMPVPNVDFFVAGNDFGAGAVGLLGQNVFHIADVEYDLANGVIRLLRTYDCKNATLAYWANAEAKPFSVIDIEYSNRFQPHTMSVAYLNGAKIHVLFDTGAATSMLTLDAAKRAGVTPKSAGVVAAGSGWGIGRHVIDTWIAPFASFKIGDEEIRNTKLRIGDIRIMGMGDTDMLIGADFFLSHRIYVATSQKKLYFTYNGGPVFNLKDAPVAAENANPSPAAASATEAQTDQPTDAAGFARRGAASAARHDYAHAIADLTRACELAPTEASYFYERGLAHGQNKEPDLALADFDAAIKLKPDDVAALVARAGVRAGRHDSEAAIVADLEQADRAAPKEDPVRMRMGYLYGYIGQPQAAIAQFSKWIEVRERGDVHMSNALHARCWARAWWGQELQQALADCNAALKLSPNTAAYLDSRGLVYLRQNQYDQAIADYDAALRLQPANASSLYGRGVARVHRGQSAQGNADLSAAAALQPQIAAEMSKHGISP
jgi:tetratricopeptide (TPR) repeat protein/predicted aspartyl protease